MKAHLVQELKAHSVADAAFQRRRRQAQLRHPLLAPDRHIPYRLADLRQRAEIVVTRHLLLVLRFFASFYGAHLDFLQRRVIAGVVERAILYPLVEQAAGLEKLDEKWHLAKAAYRGSWHPLDVNFSRESIEAGSLALRKISGDFDLTRWVSLNNGVF